eukprot:9946454-Heterocapsa_arctica.AAC.1
MCPRDFAVTVAPSAACERFLLEDFRCDARHGRSAPELRVGLLAAERRRRRRLARRIGLQELVEGQDPGH